MSLRIIGTNPVQVAPRNTKRITIQVQLLPNNIAAGNTGLVFGKFGSAPVASLESNTWDFVLNAGALDGDNVYSSRDRAMLEQELWLVSDTAAQEVNVVERSDMSGPAPSSSGAAVA